ncbi:MAG: hypothetical protein VB674_01550, partial [Vicinamibacterales bacterium]
SQDPDILRLTRGGAWQKVGELPGPLSSPAAAIIGDRLYVAGGAAGGSTVQSGMWVSSAP